MKLMKFLSDWRTIVVCLVAISLPWYALAQRPLGIDVSKYQGAGNTNAVTNVVWTSVKGDGITFTFIRSSEGVGYTDPDFVSNITQAKAAGLVAGNYHFARWDLNPGLAGADA